MSAGLKNIEDMFESMRRMEHISNDDFSHLTFGAFQLMHAVSLYLSSCDQTLLKRTAKERPTAAEAQPTTKLLSLHF